MSNPNVLTDRQGYSQRRSYRPRHNFSIPTRIHDQDQHGGIVGKSYFDGTTGIIPGYTTEPTHPTAAMPDLNMPGAMMPPMMNAAPMMSTPPLFNAGPIPMMPPPQSQMMQSAYPLTMGCQNTTPQFASSSGYTADSLGHLMQDGMSGAGVPQSSFYA